MSIYALFDEDGLPVGFWPEDVFPAVEDGGRNPAVPADAVTITAGQWRAFINNPGRRRWSGSNVVEHVPPAQPVTIDMIKSEARRRIETAWPIWRQLNIQAEGGEAFTDMRADIDAIRTRSDEIEAMDPLPADVSADELWAESF